MKINWIFAAEHRLDPSIDINQIKNIGSTWGSWKTWRSCGTDNVICDDLNKCRELFKRSFQNNCNFYVPKRYFADLGRPNGVKFYDGEFQEQLEDVEDVIAMHFLASMSDIVLLVGFDLRKPPPTDDKFVKHRIQNRLGLIRSILVNNAQTQWVLVDHEDPLDKGFQDITNLTCDKMENVIQLLV